MEIVNSPFSSDNDIPCGGEEEEEPSPEVEIPSVSLPSSQVPAEAPNSKSKNVKTLQARVLRRRALKAVLHQWKEYLYSIHEGQLNTHNLFISAPKQFLIEAQKIFMRRKAFKKRKTQSSRNKFLHQYWISLISHFNSLIWENLFGIQLVSGSPCPSTGSGKKRFITVDNISKYRQQDCQFLGIMKSTHEIQEWINFTGRTKLKKQRYIYWQSLLNKGDGSLEKKSPLLWKIPSEVPEELFSSEKILLSFEGRLVSRPSSSGSYGPITVLQFTNIMCSESVDYSQFLKIVQMYNDVWKVYCYSQLRGQKFVHSTSNNQTD